MSSKKLLNYSHSSQRKHRDCDHFSSYNKRSKCPVQVTLTKIPNFENARWRTAAILKMVLSLYLCQESSDFNEIWCADADVGSKNCHVTKYQNFANSKWRTVTILKIFLAISQRFIVLFHRLSNSITITVTQDVRPVIGPPLYNHSLQFYEHVSKAMLQTV